MWKIKFYNEFIHLMIHIVPLIILETVFYFSYITKIENDVFVSGLNDSIKYAIQQLELPEYIIQEIKDYLNTTQILPELYQDMEDSYKARDENNNNLKLRMFFSLHLLFNMFILFVFVNPLLNNKPKMIFSYPWLKKIAFSVFVILVMFLFEYFFFVMVIQHYIITTNAEMVYYIASVINTL